MKGTRVAARYAKSLIDLAQEQGTLEKAYADMKYIADLCKSNHDFLNFLKSPIIKTDKKLATLKTIFAGQLSPLTEVYIQLITSKKREVYLPEITQEFLEQYRTNKQILTAVVTTANGIDETTRKQILDLVKGTGNKDVVLEEKINKDIIGGFIIRIGDKQIDASIARKLNNLKRDLRS